MKSFSCGCRLAALLILALVLCSSAVQAQQRKRAEVKINLIDCESVKTPHFKSSEESAKFNWGCFFVKFDVKDTGTKDDWIDSMDITWKILHTEKGNGGKVRMYELTVTYEDVEKGSGHFACIFLKPKFLHRFANSKVFNKTDYSMYVEISVNGQKVASESHKCPMHAKVPDNWYKRDAEGARSERYLIPKSKTPFAGLDYDHWENEKMSEYATGGAD